MCSLTWNCYECLSETRNRIIDANKDCVLCSRRWPPAHADYRLVDGPGPRGADRRHDLLVSPTNCWVPRVLRGCSLQPHKLQPDGADWEEHPGVWHGAERAGRVAEPLRTKRTWTDPVWDGRTWLKCFVFFPLSLLKQTSKKKKKKRSCAEHSRCLIFKINHRLLNPRKDVTIQVIQKTKETLPHLPKTVGEGHK